MRKASFAPEVAVDCRVLVLGSLPGERSLAQHEYYAHPQNRFWHLVGCAIEVDIVALNYAERLAVLKANGIGLWDAIGSAKRDGSLDASIRQAEHNPLAELISSLPDLRAIAFNGRTSARIGRAQLRSVDADLIDLPSSSPAYAAMPIAEKEKHWLRLRDFLETPRAATH